MSLFRAGQPDEEAIRLLRGYEDFALKFDPRGYCVCTSEGKAREEARNIQLFKSAEEWFEWWLSDEAMEKPLDENQVLLEGF